MAFHSPSRSRERILSFGGAGQGKSFDFYTIAELSALTKSEAKFFVIDTDVSVWRMLENDALKHLTDGSGNPVDTLIIDDEVCDWQTLNAAIDRFQKAMVPERGDWLFLDMMSPAWGWVQSYFTERVFGQGTDEYFLQKRAAMKNPAKEKAFEGWTDWPVINTMYKSFQQRLLTTPGHLYATAEMKALSADQAEKDTRLLFGPHGVIPVGQKRDPYIFQSVLWKAATKPGNFEIITVKDRSRDFLKGAPVANFAKDYLMKVGGWKLA